MPVNLAVILKWSTVNAGNYEYFIMVTLVRYRCIMCWTSFPSLPDFRPTVLPAPWGRWDLGGMVYRPEATCGWMSGGCWNLAGTDLQRWDSHEIQEFGLTFKCNCQCFAVDFLGNTAC